MDRLSFNTGEHLDFLKPKDAWDALSMKEKAAMMGIAVRNGITDLKTIREKYNEFAEGGKADIHIKPENRGKFTALKERTGHSATWFKEHGTPAQKKMAVFALNSRKWKHGEGSNLFDGIKEGSQQMQIGKGYWEQQANAPTLLEQLAEFNRQQESERQGKVAALKKKIATEGHKIAEQRLLDSQTVSNDNIWVETPLTYNRKNPHLTQGASEGAKAHAVWEKEHPNLTAWGNVLGAAPFAVAAYPIAATAGSGLTALGDVAAATTVGQGITNFLAPVTKSAIASVPALEWANAGLSSLSAAHGIQAAIDEGGVSPMTALELAPMLQVAKPMAEGAATAAKTAYDNGTLWDAYTTFGGRFGNYGDNILTNIYGTAARRFGLPDKARVPADIIRKIREDVYFDNGMVDLTGNKNFLGNPHINTSIDRPVVSHGWGWDGADTYIAPTRNFLNQIQGALKSIEPSDMFSNGARFIEQPKNVTLVSGDVEALNRARKAGMQTLSSPKLRRMYDEAYAKYKQDGIFGKHPKKEQHWIDYATEVQRLQGKRGTPTLADFRLLEEQTGLTSGVAPISEMQSALEQLEAMQKAGISDISAGKIQQYVYPNGRVVDWDWNSINKEIELIKRAKYNKVFYDPASHVESDWQISNGVK